MSQLRNKQVTFTRLCKKTIRLLMLWIQFLLGIPARIAELLRGEGVNPPAVTELYVPPKVTVTELDQRYDHYEDTEEYFIQENMLKEMFVEDVRDLYVSTYMRMTPTVFKAISTCLLISFVQGTNAFVHIVNSVLYNDNEEICWSDEMLTILEQCRPPWDVVHEYDYWQLLYIICPFVLAIGITYLWICTKIRDDFPKLPKSSCREIRIASENVLMEEITNYIIQGDFDRPFLDTIHLPEELAQNLEASRSQFGIHVKNAFEQLRPLNAVDAEQILEEEGEEVDDVELEIRNATRMTNYIGNAREVVFKPDPKCVAAMRQWIDGYMNAEARPYIFIGDVRPQGHNVAKTRITHIEQFRYVIPELDDYIRQENRRVFVKYPKEMLDEFIMETMHRKNFWKTQDVAARIASMTTYNWTMDEQILFKNTSLHMMTRTLNEVYFRMTARSIDLDQVEERQEKLLNKYRERHYYRKVLGRAWDYIKKNYWKTTIVLVMCCLALCGLAWIISVLSYFFGVNAQAAPRKQLYYETVAEIHGHETDGITNKIGQPQKSGITWHQEIRLPERSETKISITRPGVFPNDVTYFELNNNTNKTSAMQNRVLRENRYGLRMTEQEVDDAFKEYTILKPRDLRDENLIYKKKWAELVAEYPEEIFKQKYVENREVRERFYQIGGWMLRKRHIEMLRRECAEEIADEIRARIPDFDVPQPTAEELRRKLAEKKNYDVKQKEKIIKLFEADHGEWILDKYKLLNNTYDWSGFLKDETYDEHKAPRMIMACSDRLKGLGLLLVEPIGQAYFEGPNTIKLIPLKERGDWLRQTKKYNAPYAYGTDYSSYEGNQTREVLLNGEIHVFEKLVPQYSEFYRKVLAPRYQLLTIGRGPNRGIVSFPGCRMSGSPDTSLGNTINSDIAMRMIQKEMNITFDYVLEGDDGLILSDEPIDEQRFREIVLDIGFDLKFDRVTSGLRSGFLSNNYDREYPQVMDRYSYYSNMRLFNKQQVRRFGLLPLLKARVMSAITNMPSNRLLSLFLQRIDDLYQMPAITMRNWYTLYTLEQEQMQYLTAKKVCMIMETTKSFLERNTRDDWFDEDDFEYHISGALIERFSKKIDSVEELMDLYEEMCKTVEPTYKQVAEITRAPCNETFKFF